MKRDYFIYFPDPSKIKQQASIMVAIIAGVASTVIVLILVIIILLIFK